MAMQLLPALQKREYEFAVVTSHGDRPLPDVMDYNGIPIHRFRFWTALMKRDFRLIRSIRERVRELNRTFNPDLVHLHFPGYLSYFHLQTMSEDACPMLLTIHTDFAGVKGGPDTLFGQILRAATWVTAVSRATLDDAAQIVPEIRERSSVIYNGLDAPALSPMPLPFNPPHVLFVGRLVQEKGVDVAITAFASLISRCPELQMTIVGDGPLRADLENLAATIAAPGKIVFAGWIDPDKIPEVMNTATVVVVPSRHAEPFALVAIQAAQMCRPVVATRMGGLCETVLDKQTGLLFEKEDSVALADSIARLLDDPEEARRMGEAGRARAQKEFNLQDCVNAYDALYRRLLKN